MLLTKSGQIKRIRVKVVQQSSPVDDQFIFCAVPLSLLRCHVCNWSSSLSLHSESFINFAADSLQTDSPLVSNKHLNSMSATDKALSDENMKGSSKILSSRLCAVLTKLS